MSLAASGAAIFYVPKRFDKFKDAVQKDYRANIDKHVKSKSSRSRMTSKLNKRFSAKTVTLPSIKPNMVGKKIQFFQRSETPTAYKRIRQRATDIKALKPGGYGNKKLNRANLRSLGKNLGKFKYGGGIGLLLAGSVLALPAASAYKAKYKRSRKFRDELKKEIKHASRYSLHGLAGAALSDTILREHPYLRSSEFFNKKYAKHISGPYGAGRQFWDRGKGNPKASKR